MTRTRRIALGSLAAVMLIPGLVSAQAKALGLGKNGDVELRAVTTIGPATLPPGSYRFQYLDQNGRHYLIVTARRPRTQDGIRSDTEVARVACLLIPLGHKSPDTALFMAPNPDGTPRITRIRIRGEAAEHVIALEPKG